MNKKHSVVFLLAAAVLVLAVFSFMSCYSVESGARAGVRDGVSQGVAGLFTKGGSSGSSGSSGTSGGTSTKPERTFAGSTQVVPWPSDTTWKKYGLDGLKQPPGTSVNGSTMVMGYYAVGLINGGEPAFNNLVAQVEAIPGVTQMSETTDGDGKVVGYQIPAGGGRNAGMVHLFVDFLSGDITIHAYPGS